MHLLISEASQLPGLGPVTGAGILLVNPVTTLVTPWLRPRLQGNRSALRGDAYNAKAADWARVQFTVRLATKNQAGVTTGDALNNLQALLTVEQSPLLGQDPQATYPSFVTDVSGAFAVEGRIAVDLTIYGTCRAKLQLIRRQNPAVVTNGPAGALFTLTQVFAEQWTLDVIEDGKLRGEA